MTIISFDRMQSKILGDRYGMPSQVIFKHIRTLHKTGDKLKVISKIATLIDADIKILMIKIFLHKKEIIHNKCINLS